MVMTILFMMIIYMYYDEVSVCLCVTKNEHFLLGDSCNHLVQLNVSFRGFSQFQFFHGSRLFLWVSNVTGWFFMVPGGFSWFFMIPRGFFMVPV